jgi:hypothetical protein
MIVERLQHFVRSLNELCDGTPKKLVFFRIGGVSSSSRIEYDVIGSMVVYHEHSQAIDTQILRYLRGALDVEVVDAGDKAEPGAMRMDLFMVIWKSLASLNEDDAEQLFWGEPDVGVIRAELKERRVQDAIRSPFSNFLYQYYDANPKPIQSFFVDHPEKDSGSFYRKLLALLIIGELECLPLSDEIKPEKIVEAPATPDLPDISMQDEGSAAEDEAAEIEAVVLKSQEDDDIADDEYISSLINTEALERRAAKNGQKANESQVTGQNGDDQNSLSILFDDENPVETQGNDENAVPEGNPLDLLEESILVEEQHQDELKELDTTLNELSPDDDSLFSASDPLIDAPLIEEKKSRTEKVKKIAGLKRLLSAAKEGF